MTSWPWKALLCSTMAVFGGGCGRVAFLVGDTVDASTEAAGGWRCLDWGCCVH